VDKPVTLVAKEAEELLALATSKGLVCSIFHNRRYDGDFKTLQEIVAKNLLGRLVFLESHFDRFRPQLSENWREKECPGNGITYDLGSHLIDQVVLLFGKPTAIWADIRKQRTDAVADDSFDIALDYPGFKARVTAGAMVNVPTPKFMLLGEKGTYQKFFLDVQEQAFKDGKIPAGADWGMEPEERWGKIHYADKAQAYPTLRGDYRIFYENVADAILGKAELFVQLEQAIPVLRIIQAAFTSSLEGRKIAQSEGKW
jgi:predicted dehydrogenase